MLLEDEGDNGVAGALHEGGSGGNGGSGNGRPVSIGSGSTGASVQRSRTLPSSSGRRRRDLNYSGGSENITSSAARDLETRGAELGLTASGSGSRQNQQPLQVQVQSAVQFADGTAAVGRREKEGGRRTVLVKKSRRASAANVEGQQQQQQQRTLF